MSILGNPLALGGGGAARKYLVKDGVAVNGSLVALGMQATSSSAIPAGAPGITQGSGQVLLGFTAGSSESRAGIVYCSEQVDLSQFSKLYLHGTWFTYSTGSYSQANLSYDIWTAIGQYQNENRLIRQPASGLTKPDGSTFDTAAKLDTRSILVFDLATLSSRPSAYIGFNFARGTSSYANVTLYDIWLE